MNVGSLAGQQSYPEPGLSLYSSTKNAVEGLTQSLRFELARHDVQVTLVQPDVTIFEKYLLERHHRYADTPMCSSIDTLLPRLPMAAILISKKWTRRESFLAPLSQLTFPPFSPTNNNNRAPFPASERGSFAYRPRLVSRRRPVHFCAFVC